MCPSNGIHTTRHLSLVDERWEVSNTEAIEKVREIMKLEGHFVGTSSGAIIKAAQEVLSRYGGGVAKALGSTDTAMCNL